MDTSRGTWTEACISTTCTAEVPKLIHKKEYLFRVRAKNNIGESEPLETTKPIVAKNPYDEPDAPERPIVTDWDRNKVELEWKPPKYDGGAPITGMIARIFETHKLCVRCP